MQPKLHWAGFELWQVKAGTIFDNILVTDDIAYAHQFAEKTWGAGKDKEKEMFDKKEEEDRKKEEEERKKTVRSRSPRPPSGCGVGWPSPSPLAAASDLPGMGHSIPSSRPYRADSRPGLGAWGWWAGPGLPLWGPSTARWKLVPLAPPPPGSLLGMLNIYTSYGAEAAVWVAWVGLLARVRSLTWNKLRTSGRGAQGQERRGQVF